MTDFKKLASYLESFSKDDPSYDVVCFIKSKIAEDLIDRETVNNGDEETLDDTEVTMSTPQQQVSENYEGNLMAPAFPELEVLNNLQKEKEEIVIPEKQKNTEAKKTKQEQSFDLATAHAFGNNAGNQKQATLFTILQRRIKK